MLLDALLCKVGAGYVPTFMLALAYLARSFALSNKPVLYYMAAEDGRNPRPQMRVKHQMLFSKFGRPSPPDNYPRHYHPFLPF